MTVGRFPWGALVVAAAVGWVFVHAPPVVAPPSASRSTWRERYPECAGADLEFLRRDEAARGTDPDWNPLPIETARNAAATALHRVLAQCDRLPSPFRLDGLFDDRDLGSEPSDADVVRLRDHGTPATDAAVLRAVRDRTLRADVRERLVSALVRHGWSPGLDVAASIAADPAEEPDLRSAALLRLPDFGLPLPVNVRDLIRDPFGDWGGLAAVVLAASGDAEAPTLVREYLRRVLPVSRRRRTLYAGAARTVCRGAADVTKAAQRVTDAEVGAHAKLSDALDAWLDANPAAFDTAHERRFRPVGDGAAIRDAWLRRTPEEILALPDGALDPAAAAAVLTHDTAEAADALLRLDRLAARVADETRDLSPERQVTAIEEILAAQFATISAVAVRSALAGSGREVDYQPSSLAWVFRRRAGNCLGWTTVWLGIAHRTGLPLRAVSAPEHVFLRWDAPGLRFNIEPTSPGRRPTDDDYRRERGIDAEFRRGDRDLRSLSAREFVSLACSNAAYEAPGGPRAERLADLAIRFDPRNADGWLVRARLHLPSSPDRAAADVESALTESQGPLGRGDMQEAAGVLRDAGRLVRAAELTAEAVRRWPDDDDVNATHAELLVDLGRADEAIELLSAARRREGVATGPATTIRGAEAPTRARLAEIHARAIVGDPTWRRQLADVDRSPLDAPWFRITLAERLLASVARPDEHARDAVEVLAPFVVPQPAANRDGTGASDLESRPRDADRRAMIWQFSNVRRVLSGALERSGDPEGAARIRASMDASKHDDPWAPFTPPARDP